MSLLEYRIEQFHLLSNLSDSAAYFLLFICVVPGYRHIYMDIIRRKKEGFWPYRATCKKVICSAFINVQTLQTVRRA